MTKYITFTIVILFVSFFKMNGQNITIVGLSGNCIYLGLENIIKIKEIKGKKITSLQGPNFLTIQNRNQDFIVLSSLQSDSFRIKLFSQEVLIDSIELKSKFLEFNQYVSSKNYGLLSKGTYIKSILLNFDSIVIKFNIPWIQTPIIRFEITIIQNDKVYHSNYLNGNHINYSKIIDAINKLTKGGEIRISQINRSEERRVGKECKSR